MNKAVNPLKAAPAAVIVLVATAGISAEQFSLGFAKHLANRGHRVYVIADGVDVLTQEHGTDRLHFISVAMSREPKLFRDFLSLLRMTIVLRRLRPDLVAYGTPKASLIAAISAFVLRVPIRVYQIWGLRLQTVHGLRRGVLAAMERITSRCSTRIVANSHSLAEVYGLMKLASGTPVDVLGRGSSHGVDLERFDRASPCTPMDSETRTFLQDTNDQFTVGYVGRLHPDKGLDTLAAATQICAANGLNLRVLLVGRDEGFEDTFKKMRQRVPVWRTGEVKDTRPYYAAMDVLVLASKREGFPNVVLEAAAMQVPAVVSDATGTVDSVVHGETGIVVPVDDSRALAEALMHLADGAGLRHAMGHAARRHVETHFAQGLVFTALERYMLDGMLTD
ncbi:glycosyltransferase family 4 protein [Tessaracoccus oleiagri]|uniref:Glycosyltransferase involved in cell wall bisynthesis n=1 Tax=Tessaracoccus oleiagri TaxID=686624 RepID=A0A1G9KFG9_9ACTN|nr:glycosyltransferase family 4 protein [Tessaracoccus oleiagri]SDL48379.1 Glycosyltransferase involved in cell wall bisynthesis [Tessaracoccus oleiagri]